MVGIPWDANTYDRTSEPQQSWASEVLARLAGIAADATVLDVGCGTGRGASREPASATFAAGWRSAPHIPMMSMPSCALRY